MVKKRRRASGSTTRRRLNPEIEFAFQLTVSDINYFREFLFHEGRKWRADFYIPRGHILVEIEGGIYTGGRHVRPVGFQKDVEKYNQATIDGYRVLRGTSSDVVSGRLLEWVKEARKKWGYYEN